jgi:4-alpha-glucanotransferase
MNWGRTSGILLHVTSLPNRYGIGDLGPEALRFADWLAAAGQRVWQVLPLGPVGYGESPYQAYSAFAGNPLLISPDRLAEHGWLDEADLRKVPRFSTNSVEFERVMPWKTRLLRRAFENFQSRTAAAEREALDRFRQENCRWLADFCRFMALKEAHGGVAWNDWDANAVAAAEEIGFHEFLQFEFFREWQALRDYCARLSIRVMGDLPIYVARDSADVWAHRDLFRLDVVAGVPPDYFSASGQLWGNPIYQWDRIGEDGYRWWIDRMRAALHQFDAVRMDHFRGFDAYWEVPATETTAIHGRWVKGPGAGLFRALERELGQLPVVAENLGVITPEVEALRQEFGFPGMAVLQFAFGKDEQARDFKPHNYVRNVVAYTGTHDNDTAVGWWRSEGGDSTRTAADISAEKARARAYLATDGRQMNWVLIRTAMASVADTVLAPMQDVLGLGSKARMNTPSVASGNWRWRCRPGVFTPELANKLREMVDAYERAENDTRLKP